MLKKTKIKIAYLTALHLFVVYTIYQETRHEPTMREYNPSYCLQTKDSKCPNTFEHFKNSKQAEELLMYEYLHEQSGELYKAQEKARKVAHPNFTNDSNIIND